MHRGPRLILLLLAPFALLATGCNLVVPEVTHQPLVHNPFPQLSRVAIVPFFNQSDDPTVDGRQFAMAYYAELQEIPGYEVVPVAAVEGAIRQFGITFDPPEQAVDQIRWLAKKLGVDAVVVGTVTDFSPYYPPRCGMRVEWYAANAGYHEIPAGYGLPWGTPQEEFIPERLVFEAEMTLARAQMATQEPIVAGDRRAAAHEADPIEPMNEPMREPAPFEAVPKVGDPFEAPESLPQPTDSVDPVAFEAPIGETDPVSPDGPTTAPAGAGGAIGAYGYLPPGWPDARGFTPPGPSPIRPTAEPNPGPVMTHTRVFRGSDADFTAALASYVDFRDDARFGGWQSYLSRSDDFVRFCCHLHLVEMLSARGGGDETRVVRRWAASR